MFLTFYFNCDLYLQLKVLGGTNTFFGIKFRFLYTTFYFASKYYIVKKILLQYNIYAKVYFMDCPIFKIG